jgi:hypothetical protein
MTTQATFDNTQSAIANAADALTGGKHKHVTLSVACKKAVVSAILLQDQADDKWLKASDLLHAEGVTVAMLEDVQYKALFMREVILHALTKKEQSLYITPKAGLSVEDRKEVIKIGNKLRAKLSIIKSHLIDRERLETMTDIEKLAELDKKAANSTLDARLSKSLDDWIKKVQEAEEVGFSATKMLEHLKAARALIKS